MPLTQEQFQKARASGFSTEQIIEFEKRRSSETEQPQAQPQSIPNQIFNNIVSSPTTYSGMPAPFNIMPPEMSAGAIKGSMNIASLPYTVPKTITQFGQEQLQQIPQVRQIYENPATYMGMPAPMNLLSLPIPSELRRQTATNYLSEAGGFGGAYGVSKLAKTFKPQNWLNPNTQKNVAQETRNALFQLKRDAVNKYGKVYDKVIKQGQGKVSLQEPLLNLIDESDDVVSTIKGQQEISEALLKGDPQAKRVMGIVEAFMKDPKTLESLSLQEADALQKYINNLPSIRTKLARSAKLGLGQVDLTNAERVLVGFSDDIKAQVLNLAPEMNLVNKEYGFVTNSIKKLRPFVKEGTAIDSFKKFNTYNAEIKDWFNILPPKTLQKIMNINRAEIWANIAKRIGIGAAYTAGGTIVGGVGYKLFGKR